MVSVKKKYSNGEVTIVWKPDLCIHARTCFLELPKVFDPLERPWINPNGASTDEIISTVNKCPTQALSWYYNNSGNDAEKATQTGMCKITIRENGPYLIEGNYKVLDSKGNEVVTEGITALCRCGYSKRKPFCDGAHKEGNFTDQDLEY
jgi:CDGSH-type Zn-finger protein/uncharacterized Fe-S cluster protein YjdI